MLSLVYSVQNIFGHKLLLHMILNVRQIHQIFGRLRKLNNYTYVICNTCFGVTIDFISVYKSNTFVWTKMINIRYNLNKVLHLEQKITYKLGLTFRTKNSLIN